MIEVSVVDNQGREVEKLQVNEEILGKSVHRTALRMAIQMYESNRRVGTASTKRRGEIAGSTKKLFPQKHTGRARAGDRKAPHWRGGYVVFGPRPRSYSSSLPRKVRLLALRSAYLSKLLDKELIVINELKLDAPKTREIAALLRRLNVEQSCLIGIKEANDTLWKSARNLPRVDLKPVGDISAYDVLLRRRLLMTKEALQAVLDRFSAAPVAAGGATA